MRPSGVSYTRKLFYREYVDKAGYVEYFHYILVYVAHDHFALLVHNLLRRQQHAQTGGRYVFQIFQIEYQRVGSYNAVFEFGLKLRRGRR